ncbi:MAG: polysaccharide biosynthesis/export family protein [Kaistella sp.]
MKLNYPLVLLLIPLFLYSCISTKDVRYMQPNENLVINEEGLIPYNIPIYRVTKNDMLNLNIVTTPKGDAAQFYSALNAALPTAGTTAGATLSPTTIQDQGGNANFYFNGLKVDSKGDINIMGIGFVKAEGRTLEDITLEIQNRVNENFLEGKSEVRLNTDGITYYILGDVETVEISGEKKTHKNTLTLTEAISISGGLNRTVDRTNIVIHRKLPEGIKIARIDLTREDVMNSPYYWVQNGDEIFLNTRAKNLNGLGKDPVQTITTGVSVLTTALSVYLILTRL